MYDNDEHYFYPCPVSCNSNHKPYKREYQKRKWIPCNPNELCFDGHRALPYHYYDYVSKNESPDYIEIFVVSYFNLWKTKS